LTGFWGFVKILRVMEARVLNQGNRESFSLRQQLKISGPEFNARDFDRKTKAYARWASTHIITKAFARLARACI
jgi:hypothetical protein